MKLIKVKLSERVKKILLYVRIELQYKYIYIEVQQLKDELAEQKILIEKLAKLVSDPEIKPKENDDGVEGFLTIDQIESNYHVCRASFYNYQKIISKLKVYKIGD